MNSRLEYLTKQKKLLIEKTTSKRAKKAKLEKYYMSNRQRINFHYIQISLKKAIKKTSLYQEKNGQRSSTENSHKK